MLSEEKVRRLQQAKYYLKHKQYKVYLDTKKDADIIAKLEAEPKKTKLIRKALICYLRGEAI